MPQRLSFTNTRSYVIAEISVDGSATRGTGGPGYPRLVFPLEWKLSPTSSKADQWITAITAQLFIGQSHDRIADAVSKPLNLALRPMELQNRTELEFPLDRYRVELLEQSRNGGDMNFRLDMQILLARYGERVHYANPNLESMPLAFEFETPSQSSNLSVPESVWRQNALPGLGYGIVHILEFPAVALSACEQLQHSYIALKRAHAKFTAGDYDEAIWQCRTAVDPLRKELKEIKDGSPDSLSADWAEKIGAATVDWLLTFFGKTHGVANTPSHSPNTGHFSRLDAQMILALTTAVVAYAARTKAAEV